MDQKPTTPDEFRAMCQRHDLTHAYSDDSRWWRAGVAELDAIKTAAKTLPPGEAARIWNEVVRGKIADPEWHRQFLWVESEVAA